MFVIDRKKYPSHTNIEKGGYILVDNKNPEIMIFATGSEVSLALELVSLLSDYDLNVINLACWELFEDQDDDYKSQVLACSSNTLLVSIEAGITNGWQKFTGRNGLNIGIDSFGESAPGKVVADHFGLNAKTIHNKILSFIKEN